MNLKQKILRIKEKVSIKDVVDIYGIKQSNYKRNYHCPFHGEDKKPSASISKGFFHCFTCGKSWDVIGFVKEYEKCSLGNAVKLLDEKFCCGCGTRLSKEEYIKLKEKERQRNEKQRKKKFWQEFENDILNEIYKKLKFWELMRDTTQELEFKIDGNKYDVSAMFFQSLKKIDWLTWLYETILGLSPPLCEFSYFYGIDPKNILRKIYKKEIKI